MMYGSFSNFGFIRDTVPADLLEKLRLEVSTLDPLQNHYNNNLAGNIEKEYKLEKHQKELGDYVISLCEQYPTAFSLTQTSKDLDPHNLELYTYWANIQRKHEFNPMHTHDGMYSFAIWLKVPFKMQDELASPSATRSNMPRPGMFTFIYTNVFGEIREAEFPVDESYEGTIFVFPACLPHSVYPFSTSDEYRISISGNLRRKQ